MNAPMHSQRIEKEARRRALRFVARHPFQFTVQVLKAFRKNHGLLLAGAVAYYSLLSIVPLLILVAIAFSHVIGQALLAAPVGL